MINLLSSVILSLTLIGTGQSGFDNTLPTFNQPTAVVATDNALFVIDRGNHLIRQLDEMGIVTTLNTYAHETDTFGSPLGGFRNGSLRRALFNNPFDAVMDSRGRLFVTDTNNNAIRLIQNHTVTTFVSGLNAPHGIAIDAHDNIYVVNTLEHTILKITPNATVSVVAGVPDIYGYQDGEVTEALFNYPTGIAIDDAGRLFVSDTNNHLIRLIDGDVVSTLAGQFVPSDDPLYPYPLGGFDDGEVALFNFPMGLAWSETNLFVADTANHLIRLINLDTGITRSIIGTGYPDFLHAPQGVSFANDTLFIADTANHLVLSTNLTELLATPLAPLEEVIAP